MSRNAKLIEELVAIESALAPVLAEHLEDYEELLPYLFMADLVRWLDARADIDRASVVKILDFLEARFDKDELVDNLISTGFLENLYPDSPAIPLLGPELAQEYKSIYPPH